MDMKRTKNRIFRWMILVALTVTLLFGAVVTYAYFSTIGWVITNDGTKQIAQIGMNISLLFDRLDPDIVSDGTALNIGTSTYDSAADWGTEQNPYIISDIRHLQNLSVLQEIGYFNELYIKNNYTDGTYNNGTEIPYFLVCNPDGTPVTIDGSKITFAPIGTDEFPFIGYVGGAFTNGTTTTGGKSSTVSVLENIHVVTTNDVTDVGLFSVISCLGSESTAVDGVFSGVVSTVRDLVLSDVTVTVQNPSWIQVVADHLFTFSALSETDKEEVPHENHHIGILAGHVEYANVQYVSVYYSADDKIAIDLMHTNASENGENPNYLSISGILGFVHSMNPEVTEAGISVGSGINNGDLDVSAGGAGTGGGLSSGTGRGYVTAEGVYNLYSYIAANRLGEQLCYDFYLEGDETATKYTGIKLLKTGGKYYLEDGVTEVTVANGEASFGNTVTNSFFVGIDDGNGGFTYKDKTETTNILRFNTTPLRLMDAKNSEGNPLCTEYIRNRLFWGTEHTGLYYFYDGVFTFALSSQQDTIEDTWDNGKVDSFTIGTNVDAMWKANTTKGNNSVVAYVKEINSLEELQAIIGVKQIYIGYPSADGTKISLMSLTDSDTGSNDFLSNFGDDKYTTTALTQSWVISQTDIDSIQETLKYARDNGEAIEGMLPLDKDGNRNDDIIDNIGNYLLINLGTGDNLDAIKNRYTIDVSQGTNDTGLFRFMNSGNYMALLRQRGRITGTNTYSIWAGASVPSNSWFFQYYWQKEAHIDFDADGNVKIWFYYDDGNGVTATRYVQYDSTNDKFKGNSSDTATGTTLTLYTVEGTSNLNFGRITFDPISGDTNMQTFQTDEYVLFATQVYSGGGGRTDGYAEYDVISLEELRAKDSGWKNSLGEDLTSKDLHKKFAMAKGASFGATLTILNGNFSIGDGTIVAPIGTLGVEANIPTGLIAFRVNKNGESKIRVIVAVPQTPYYKGETGYDLSDEPYYFGLWQSEANGANILSSFTADSAIAKFEIPRSNTYQPGTSPGGTDSNYVLANYGGEQYRCYLNSNMVLVAYTFTVYNEGVYLLGSTNGPMEIVYFSADGTASAGRDGSSGSRLGNIDFVYDHSGKIVPVTDAAEDGGTENFDSYYASLCILYTDNGYGGVGNYPDVNDLQIHIRRTATDGVGTQITYQVKSTVLENAVLAQVARYSISADTVERSPDDTR